MEVKLVGFVIIHQSLEGLQDQGLRHRTPERVALSWQFAFKGFPQP